MWNEIADKVITFLFKKTLPLVLLYHSAATSVFISVAAENSSGLEKIADALLIPTHYLFAGQSAHLQVSPEEEPHWIFEQRFSYEKNFWIKTLGSAISLPISLPLGLFTKTLAYCFSPYKDRFNLLVQERHASYIVSNNSSYQIIGIDILPPESRDFLSSLNLSRRVGDEKQMKHEKKALKEIASLLNQAKILWWVDCGTCLGTYRYSGVIPWDLDIDIAVLAPDFDNVFRTLQALNPEKYQVQDWSSRDRPKTYLKVFVKPSKSFIDIYHFAIDQEKQQIQYILSLENHLFLPESWNIRERRFKIPIAFSHVFPLKKASFDSIEVFIPNHTETYLQRCYGEDLSPAKIFDPTTQSYEKNLSHPYWERVHAH